MPANGDIITTTPNLINSTYYVLLNRDTLKYLGFNEEEIQARNLEIVMSYEHSEKWGNYIGIGKKGKH